MIGDAVPLRAHCARYVGVPFIEHGRDPIGWDCWGLLRFVGAEIGLGRHPSYAECYERADGDGAVRVGAAIDQYLGNWRPLERAVPGCAVLFRRFGRAFHVGLTVSGNEMLHVSRDMAGGTTIERFDTFVWSRLYAGAFLPVEKGGV